MPSSIIQEYVDRFLFSLIHIRHLFIEMFAKYFLLICYHISHRKWYTIRLPYYGHQALNAFTVLFSGSVWGEMNATIRLRKQCDEKWWREIKDATTKKKNEDKVVNVKCAKRICLLGCPVHIHLWHTIIGNLHPRT